MTTATPLFIPKTSLVGTQKVIIWWILGGSEREYMETAKYVITNQDAEFLHNVLTFKIAEVSKLTCGIKLLCPWQEETCRTGTLQLYSPWWQASACRFMIMEYFFSIKWMFLMMKGFCQHSSIVVPKCRGCCSVIPQKNGCFLWYLATRHSRSS